MNETAGLLHNMSAPPKTVVRYTGLADFTAAGAHRASAAGGALPDAPGTFGRPVLFELDAGFRGDTPGAVLRRMGRRPGAHPDRQLERLLEARAAELPLPDGCVAIEPEYTHQPIWRDALTVLAVLTKCSGTVWLRAKQPMLGAALERRAVTLLVPPAFVGRLPERAE